MEQNALSKIIVTATEGKRDMDFNLNINSNVPIGLTFNLSPITEQKLDQALALLNQLMTDQKKELIDMSNLSDKLVAAAADQKTLVEGLTAIVTTYHDEIVAAGNDTAAQQAALDQFNANSAAITASLTANTPAAQMP